MTHGGYHGTVTMGGNIIQQGNPDGSISGGLGNAALNIPVNQSQNNQATYTVTCLLYTSDAADE